MLACAAGRATPLALEIHTSRVLVLPGAVVAEVEAAACARGGSFPDVGDGSRSSLPRTHMFGALLRNRLRRTDGCRKLTLPPGHGLDADALRLLFVAIGQALGEVRPPVLRSEGGEPAAVHGRPRLRTDGGDGLVPPDFVGLLVDEPRARTFDVLLSPAILVRRKLAHHAPAVLRVLHRDYLGDPCATVAAGGASASTATARLPVFVADDEPAGWTLRYARERLERSHALANDALPRDALAAFDLLDELLGDPDHVLRVPLAAGDMLWFNNRTVAHACCGSDPAAPPPSAWRIWVGSQALPQRAGA